MQGAGQMAVGVGADNVDVINIGSTSHVASVKKITEELNSLVIEKKF